jgi:hypothetical protein
MRPRELFGVSVRVLAIWFWTQALYWGYFGLLKASEIGVGNPKISPREDIAYAIFYVFLGIALMAGARALVWLAYGDAPKQDTSASSH